MNISVPHDNFNDAYALFKTTHLQPHVQWTELTYRANISRLARIR